jgi:ribonuclease VapC
MSGEPEVDLFAGLMELADTCVLTSMNLLELRLVIAFSKGMPVETVDDFLRDYRIDIVPFDETLSNLAFDAYRRFGKGRHPAKLNMGDCAAYALATSRGWPLLFKGDDFARTDVERA